MLKMIWFNLTSRSTSDFTRSMLGGSSAHLPALLYQNHYSNTSEINRLWTKKPFKYPKT